MSPSYRRGLVGSSSTSSPSADVSVWLSATTDPHCVRARAAAPVRSPRLMHQGRCLVNDVAGRGLKPRRCLHGPVAVSPQPRMGNSLDDGTMKQPTGQPRRFVQSRRHAAGWEPVPPGRATLWRCPSAGTSDIDRLGAHVPTIAGPVSKCTGVPCKDQRGSRQERKFRTTPPEPSDSGLPTPDVVMGSDAKVPEVPQRRPRATTWRRLYPDGSHGTAIRAPLSSDWVLRGE